MASKLKLSGAAVVLIMVVPLFMYASALVIGIQLGTALERSPDSDSVSFSMRGAFAYLAKELWGANNVSGRRRGRDGRAARVWVPVPANLAVVGDDESSANKQSSSEHEHRRYIPLPRVENSTKHAQHQQRYHKNNHTLPLGVISVGSWGGSGGQPFYMRGGSSRPRLIRSITLYHSTAIHSLACDYYDSRAAAGPWGLPESFGYGGVRATIELPKGEHVTAVAGTIGHFVSVPDAVVTSLTFRTSTGRTYGPYGSTTATSFSVPAVDGACIVGFWGRSDRLLDAIGVYVKPSCSSLNPAKPFAVRHLTHMEKS